MGRFIDKLPEITYITEDEFIKNIIKLNNMEVERGTWIKFPDNKPEDGERVLILKHGYVFWEVYVYNEIHQCWDDSEGDDYMCDLDEVEYWMRIPKAPKLAK